MFVQDTFVFLLGILNMLEMLRCT